MGAVEPTAEATAQATMRIAAAVLAAGQGARFGADKTSQTIAGKPVWRWSYDRFAAHGKIDQVIVVGSPLNRSQIDHEVTFVVGGETRSESARRALEACSDADLILIHDAARPFVSDELIDRVIESAIRVGASAPAIPVIDTVRQSTAGGYQAVDRSKLVAMQTPQAFSTELLRLAFESAPSGVTDDIAAVEALGISYEIVAGDVSNFKITQPEDMLRARAMMGSGQIRTGIGYDIHRFSIDPHRPCVLGSVTFDDAPGLEGHSDADVLLHSITDAILGAAALGDIGEHFPNTDERWRNQPSTLFLAHAARLVREQGWQITNIDSTVIAERPKVMRRSAEMRDAIATCLGIDAADVGVKATTNEGLGAIGRSEGVAAFAIATVERL